MIDFKKKLTSKQIQKKTNPVELYETLDRKSVIGPLRQAQIVILNNWYEHAKEKKDLIIKLHTGEGKTLVGLLILQSLINAKEGSCLYVSPNNYLVNQVCQEAEKFGISICVIGDDRRLPIEFLSGGKILVTTVQKLFNGKSIFGIDNNYIHLGAIVLDDAHACVDAIKKHLRFLFQEYQMKIYIKAF